MKLASEHVLDAELCPLKARARAMQSLSLVLDRLVLESDYYLAPAVSGYCRR